MSLPPLIPSRALVPSRARIPSRASAAGPENLPDERPVPMTDVPRARPQSLWRNPRLRAAAPMLLDMATPVLGFVLLHLVLGMSAIVALTAGAVAAGVRTVWTTVRTRRVNAFSGMMLILLCATVLLVFVTGDPRLILAKTAVVPFLGGVYGIVTNYVGRALIFDVVAPFVTRGDPALTDRWARLWDDPAGRDRIRLINLVWAIGFITGAVVRVVIVYSLPLSVAVFAGQVPTLAALAVLIASTRVLARPLAARMRSEPDAELNDAVTPGAETAPHADAEDAADADPGVAVTADAR